MAMYFFLFIGGPLPAPAVVSTHTVGVEECSLKCLEEFHCRLDLILSQDR